MPVMIHGNKYVTVAERLKLAQADLEYVVTNIITNDENEVLVKAVIKTKKGMFVGHASSNKKSPGIEGQSPVEVAETSALGRALGFAGYGVIDGIASAEEMKKIPTNFTSNKYPQSGSYRLARPNYPIKKMPVSEEDLGESMESLVGEH